MAIAKMPATTGASDCQATIHDRASCMRESSLERSVGRGEVPARSPLSIGMTCWPRRTRPGFDRGELVWSRRSEDREVVIPFPTMSFRSAGSQIVLFFAVATTGCAAVYPELQTPVRTAESREIEAPPNDLRWLAFKGAIVPAETRDGRKWGG